MNCTVDNCDKPAEYTFVWPWGTPGACCTHHVGIVQQKSKATRGRFGQVGFTKLDPDRSVPITRDERIELHSARLTAESERDDARKRSSELYALNLKLADEVRMHRARCAQLEADVKALRAQVEAAVVERDAALVAADKAREEAEFELEEKWGVATGGDDGPRRIPQQPPADEVVTVDEGPARDEHGRFTPQSG